MIRIPDGNIIFRITKKIYYSLICWVQQEKLMENLSPALCVLSGEWTLLTNNNNIGPMCYCILNNFPLSSILPDGPDDTWEIVAW